MNSLTYQRVSVKATDRDTGRQRPAEERGARYRRVQFRPPAIELTSRTYHMRHTYMHTSTSVSQCRIYSLEKKNAIQTHPREYTHTHTHTHRHTHTGQEAGEVQGGEKETYAADATTLLTR